MVTVGKLGKELNFIYSRVGWRWSTIDILEPVQRTESTQRRRHFTFIIIIYGIL